MATKIRLQRHGRKKKAFFHIVVTDSRAPRDGRFIEKLGTYNPITNPATIDINLDSAVDWLVKGATPSDTVKAILSYKGAMLKKHLQVGVSKGAITQEQADAKFATWVVEKEGKVQGKRDRLANEKAEKSTAAKKAETARKEAIAAKVLAKTSELAAETEVAEVTEVADTTNETVEENAPEVVESVETAGTTETEETPVAETPAAETTESPETTEG